MSSRISFRSLAVNRRALMLAVAMSFNVATALAATPSDPAAEGTKAALRQLVQLRTGCWAYTDLAANPRDAACIRGRHAAEGAGRP